MTSQRAQSAKFLARCHDFCRRWDPLENMFLKCIMNEMIYETPRLISSAYIDSTVRLGVAQTLLVVQDNVTECFGRLKCDGVIYRKKYNAFWVFTKALIHFNHRPDWCETVTTRTFPIDNGGLRTHINSEAFDKNGELAFAAYYEACVLSFENHRPQKLATLGYPTENFPTPVFSAQFTRFPAFSCGTTGATSAAGTDVGAAQKDATDATQNDTYFVFEQKIRSSLIDMSQHMNNTEYVKLALSTFTNDYLREHDILELEAHFTGESKEGQTLRVYRRDEDSNTFVYIKESERLVFECRITFK